MSVGLRSGLPIAASPNTFLYFAYGSNLLESRLKANIGTAVRRCRAKLEGYRLDFNLRSKRWNGSSATIVPDQGAVVWGAVWQVRQDQERELDRQEGVHRGIYRHVRLNVITDEGQNVECHSYMQTKQPDKGPILPPERYPSKAYLDTIIKGAIESGLPPEYIDSLRSIPHNSFDGPVNLSNQLQEDPIKA